MEHRLGLALVYQYSGAQRSEQFLQVIRLYRALILLGLALYHPSTIVSSYLHGTIMHSKLFVVTSLFYLLMSGAWRDWPLTWLTNYCPSVL